MERRKLFIYALSQIAGIMSAYMIFERGEYIKAFVLIACFFITEYLLMRITIKSSLKGNLDDDEDVQVFRKRKRIYLFFVLGILSFSLAFLQFSSYEIDEGRYETIVGRVSKVREMSDRTEYTLNGRILCTFYFDETADDLGGEADPLELLGREVKISGNIKIPEASRNPGAFDYRRYLKSKGIKYQMELSDIAPLYDAEPVRADYLIKRFLLRKRRDFENNFEDPEIRAFVKGVIFGDKSEISDETYEAFRDNGTAHILAVSGLHIGMILALLRYLSGRKRALSVEMMIAAVMMFYGEMTMWNASTVRSVIIMLIGMLAFHLARPFDFLTAITSSAIIMLTLRPYILFESGFQMSFLAVCGIAFAGKALTPLLGSKASYLVSIQLAIIPYTACMYNRINPMSIFINLIIVSIVSVLIPVAISGLMISLIAGQLISPFVFIISAVSDLTMRANSSIDSIGDFATDIVSINVGILIGIYMIIAFISSENFRILVVRREWGSIRKIILVLLIPLIGLGYAFHDPFKDCELVFIDVGQGDAIHLRSGNRDIMFDGGGSYLKDIGKTVLRPYYLKAGVRDLDAAILTHLHMDHYKAAKELSDIFPIDRFYISEIYETYEDLPTKHKFMGAGDVMELSPDVHIEVLWPLGDEKISGAELDENEYNMVMMVNYEGIRLIITGDLLEEDERKMIEYYESRDEMDKLKCDILKIAHHGSKTSSSEGFLDAADPDIAVIQVGKNNNYGHPSKETIERLEARNITIARSDEAGAIGIDVEGDAVRIIKMIGR